MFDTYQFDFGDKNMKGHSLRILGIMCVAALVCFLQFGCQQHAAQSQNVTPAPPVPGVVEGSTVKDGTIKKEEVSPQSPAAETEAPAEAEGAVPEIKFEDVVCDLGDIRPGSANICDFKFTNTGRSLLKITNVSKTCGCTLVSLKKNDYVPGESGVLQVSYNAGNRAGPVAKRLNVSTNDPKNPEVAITVKAMIAEIVSCEPKRLDLMLNKENAGCPDITLKSANNKPFSVKSFKTSGRFQSTEDCITADFDPAASATEFVLHPKVNMEKLRKGTSGMIVIIATCPENQTISIPFNMLPRFKIEPRSITVFNAKAGKSVTREVWIVNNYNENFEVESTSSEKGAMKVLSQETKDNRCKLGLEITPPVASGKEKVFTDVLYINIKNDEKLQISCHGYYAKEVSVSSGGEQTRGEPAESSRTTK